MTDSSSSDSQYLREIIAERSKRADEQRALGLDPFPPRTGRTHTLAEAREFFVASEAAREPEPTEPVTIAGRAHAIRNMGRIAFIDLEDDSGALQVLASRRALGDAWERIDSFDLGDFIEASGKMIRSRAARCRCRPPMCARWPRPYGRRPRNTTGCATRSNATAVDTST